MRESDSPSWFNPMETVEVVKYLQAVLHDDNVHISCNDIGVITPYRKQVIVQNHLFLKVKCILVYLMVLIKTSYLG